MAFDLCVCNLNAIIGQPCIKFPFSSFHSEGWSSFSSYRYILWSIYSSAPSTVSSQYLPVAWMWGFLWEFPTVFTVSLLPSWTNQLMPSEIHTYINMYLHFILLLPFIIPLNKVIALFLLIWKICIKAWWQKIITF